MARQGTLLAPLSADDDDKAGGGGRRLAPERPIFSSPPLPPLHQQPRNEDFREDVVNDAHDARGDEELRATVTGKDSVEAATRPRNRNIGYHLATEDSDMILETDAYHRSDAFDDDDSTQQQSAFRTDTARMKNALSAMKDKKANSLSMNIQRARVVEGTETGGDDISLRERARHKLLKGAVPDPFLYFQSLNILTPQMRASTLQRYTKRGVLLLREVLQPQLSIDGMSLDNLHVKHSQTIARPGRNRSTTPPPMATLGDIADTFSFNLTLLVARNIPRCDVRATADGGAQASLRPVMVRLARVCLFDGKKFIGNTHVIAAQPHIEKTRGRAPVSRMITTTDGDNSTSVVASDCDWRFDGKNSVVVRFRSPRQRAANAAPATHAGGSIYIYVEMNVSFAFGEEDRRIFDTYSARTRAAQVDEVCTCWGFIPFPSEHDVDRTPRGRGRELRVPLKVGRLTLLNEDDKSRMLAGMFPSRFPCKMHTYVRTHVHELSRRCLVACMHGETHHARFS